MIAPKDSNNTGRGDRSVFRFKLFTSRDVIKSETVMLLRSLNCSHCWREHAMRSMSGTLQEVLHHLPLSAVQLPLIPAMHNLMALLFNLLQFLQRSHNNYCQTFFASAIWSLVTIGSPSYHLHLTFLLGSLVSGVLV